MIRRALLPLLALLLAACSDTDSATGPSPEPPPISAAAVSGAYVLTRVDGQAVPADMTQNTLPTQCGRGTDRFCVLRGALSIVASGSFVWSVDWTRYYSVTGIVDQTGHVERTGTWIVAGDSIVFTPPANSGPCRHVGRINAAGEVTLSDCRTIDGQAVTQNSFTFKRAD